MSEGTWSDIESKELNDNSKNTKSEKGKDILHLFTFWETRIVFLKLEAVQTCKHVAYAHPFELMQSLREI